MSSYGHHNHHTQHSSNTTTKHVKKKAKNEPVEQPAPSRASVYRHQTSNTATLEPRRDMPLHKIPELLAKITGSFSSSSTTATSSSVATTTITSAAEQLFQRYADASSSQIQLDGLLRFCADLQLEPESYELLLFCFACRAKQMYMLTREEFLHGLKTLQCDSLSLLRSRLISPQVPLIGDNNVYDEFYAWTYHFGLDGQRSLSTPNAISLWRLFYSRSDEDRKQPPNILTRWLTFLDDEKEHVRSITCDTWTVFPQFARFIEANGFAAYDDSEAWPCLFDSFVERERELRMNE